jgi:cell division protein FtsB
VSARATATSPAASTGKKTGTPAAPGRASVPRRRRTRISGRATILLFALFVTGTFAIAPTRAFLDQRARLHALELEADALHRSNGELARRLADLENPVTLERIARECLGMVEPGEIAFVTVPKKGAPTPPDCG